MVKFQNTQTLKDTLEAFLQDVIKGVVQFRVENNKSWSKSADEKDYPKVITACEYAMVTEPGRSERGRCKVPRVPVLHREVIAALTKVAPPGIIIPQTKDGLHYGTCAEDDAATKVLNGLERNNVPLPSINNLAFIQPIRPRTQENVDCCTICKQIFG